MTAEGPAAISCAGIGFLCDENLSLPLPLSWMTALLRAAAQYDRGMPRTCWPIYASIRLVEIGAVW
jgi:hypothetical protein